MQKKLTNHPDFTWTSLHLKDKQVTANLANVKAMAGKSHHGQRFKFGVQIPHDTSHAIHLDKVSNNNLWKAAANTELDSINEFETFKVLEDHEEMPVGHIKMPHHLTCDCKFDGRRKARLVAGGHITRFIQELCQWTPFAWPLCSLP